MSRVGKRPVTIPFGVTATVEGQTVKMKGPKGQLQFIVHDDVEVKFDHGAVTVAPRIKTNRARAMYGTARAQVANLIEGVTKGFEKKLEITGVGYRAASQPNHSKRRSDAEMRVDALVRSASAGGEPADGNARRLAFETAKSTPVREESNRLRHITDLLGGPKVIGKYPADPLAAHEMLERGLPNTAIKHLLDGMTTLSQKSIEGALGMSERTRQRREKNPTELLSPDQAGRTWKFAEVLTRAISVFGSRTAAEQWLVQPATGLEQRRPIDLLTTPAGVELVEDFLGRIEYGVYT